MVFCAHQEAPLFQVFQYLFARGITVQPGITAGILVHAPLVVHDVDLGQLVPQSDLKIIGIVRRSNLHRSSPEFRVS